MARYRSTYRSRRRRKQDTIWQPGRNGTGIETVTAGASKVGWLSHTYQPRIGDEDSGPTIDRDLTLQRTRGELGITASAADAYVSIALVIAPHKFLQGATDSDAPDLSDTSEGNDFPVYMACVSGTQSRYIPIDSKAKRKMEYGNAFRWLYHLVNGATTTNRIALAINFRMLWTR